MYGDVQQGQPFTLAVFSAWVLDSIWTGIVATPRRWLGLPFRAFQLRLHLHMGHLPVSLCINLHMHAHVSWMIIMIIMDHACMHARDVHTSHT